MAARPPRARAVLDAPRARAVALDLLSRKAWSRRELGQRLLRRGAPRDVAEAVASDLEARGYVDDRALALAWADSRARGRGLGSRRIREELAARGVARPLVEEALRDAVTLEEEEARARAAARRRVSTMAHARPEQVARRLSGYLGRRGFPADVVRRVVRQVTGFEVEDS